MAGQKPVLTLPTKMRKDLDHYVKQTYTWREPFAVIPTAFYPGPSATITLDRDDEKQPFLLIDAMGDCMVAGSLEQMEEALVYMNTRRAQYPHLKPPEDI